MQAADQADHSVELGPERPALRRRLRKDAGLTLKLLSRRTNLSVSLLSQIERAESSASISSLYKIASALDVRIQDLFGEY